jgi:hypothetical protein
MAIVLDRFMFLLSLACLCCTCASSDIDLADWASGSWGVTVDGVMGKSHAGLHTSSFRVSVRAKQLPAWHPKKENRPRNTFTHVRSNTGGKSSGKLNLLAGGKEGVLFSGDINLDGGGFSSIRRSFRSKDLSGYAGVLIEVDAIVADGGSIAPPQGITFQLQQKAAAFAVPVAGTVARATIFLPFSAFQHIVYRGTPGPLDTSSISSMDVYILYQPGPFSITLRSIVAVKNSADQAAVPRMDMTDKQVEGLIQSTIKRGSTAYNKDQIQVCGAIYQSTMRTIAQASGPAPEVKEVATTALAVVSTKQYDFNWGDQPAWIYRKGFDAILAFYGASVMPSDENYPAYAAGAWANDAMSCGTKKTCGARTSAEMTDSTAAATASYASAASSSASSPQQPLVGSDSALPPSPSEMSAALFVLVIVAVYGQGQQA